ncbi:acyl-CoA dehydrogenase family protein [Cryptosporangium aurantiacum]|uniref:Acyl-CoA dehydrogenase n=1 Tax=Cryptosporangium aurantiacum TaxID=134849 RepID=A0A1M7KM82_9ACTN|nr:acyl-CoA dehydrogenase family protein [Cryptosporangium aurantiacum]SHM66532.1 Acyl-CoA dehydrogenase [Cryptosporangium aurantiacum]
MSTELLELHDDLRAVARDLLGAQPSVDRGTLAEAGWAGLEVPDALGGADATFAEVAVVLEEMGRAATRSGYLGAVLSVGTLGLLAPSTTRDELLRDVAHGTVAPAAAIRDAGNSGLADGVPFRLERGLRLTGRATFVPDAVGADRILLLAEDPDGAVVVVVPELSAVRIVEQPVLDETRCFGVVEASDLPVPADAVVRFAGDPAVAVRRLVDRAAAAVACDSLGISEAVLDATVAHVRTREQFGRPIGSFQAVKHACADLYVRASLARLLVSDAAARLDEAAVSRAKSYACEAAVEAAGTAMQLHGAIGYAWESGIHAYLKRAALNRALFGSPAEHRQRLAARWA